MGTDCGDKRVEASLDLIDVRSDVDCYAGHAADLTLLSGSVSKNGTAEICSDSRPTGNACTAISVVSSSNSSMTKATVGFRKYGAHDDTLAEARARDRGRGALGLRSAHRVIRRNRTSMRGA
ncbi:hypothetical protein [Paraburkholderia kururiensis]|uniref:hypothetical protein n=1 Tax=Paraburkholderia kururiensis TaxID=984307 RepID=UPI0012E09224|nr:hypothetical protein [Paraburkholderia kururiensis]